MWFPVDPSWFYPACCKQSPRLDQSSSLHPPLTHGYSGNQAYVSSWATTNRDRVSRNRLDLYPTFLSMNPSFLEAWNKPEGCWVSHDCWAPELNHLRSPLLLTKPETESTVGSLDALQLHVIILQNGLWCMAMWMASILSSKQTA